MEEVKYRTKVGGSFVIKKEEPPRSIINRQQRLIENGIPLNSTQSNK
jgi:hypothetical protein